MKPQGDCHLPSPGSCADGDAQVSVSPEIPSESLAEIPTEPGRSPAQSRWNQGWFLALLLVVATMVAYSPAWNGEAVYDDDDHLTPTELASFTGLGRIWTELGVVSQYYPVAHSVFWIQNRLWGHWMPGYHVVNILLHSLSALLLVLILRRLEIPGAWLAAGIFALHPVLVESVAWISELKNTLSGAFYLGAALAYLRFYRTRERPFYVAACLLFIAGLLSKSVIASLPAALLVVFWWKRGRLSWKQDALPLLPFFVAAAAMGILTAWVEKRFIGAQGEAFALSLVERCLVAGRAFWFYLGKLVWPADLVFIYPRWQVSETVWWQWMYPVAAVVLAGVCWGLRKRRRGPLAALLFFGGTLFPALGFINVYPFRYSFVADHYQYLATLGPIVLAAAWWKPENRNAQLATTAGREPAPAGVSRRWRVYPIRLSNFEFRISTAAAFLLLGILGGLSWHQCHMYRDVETLWRTTIARNPACFVAYSNLGNYCLQEDRIDEAIRLCQKAIDLQPAFAEPHNNLGNAWSRKGRMDAALAEYRKALELRPDLAVAWCNIGSILVHRGQVDEALAHFRKSVELRPEFVSGRNYLGNTLLQIGRVDEAIQQFQQALAVLPDDAATHGNLGNALLEKSAWNDAIAHLRKALAIEPRNAKAHNDLGNALLGSGRIDDAIAQYQQALSILPDFDLAHHNIGCALLQKGAREDAIAHFRKVIQLQPALVPAHEQLANALMESGRVDEALAHYRKVAELQPHNAEARMHLAGALLRQGQAVSAVAHCRAALKLQPDNPEILSSLAWLLATWPEPEVRNGTEAVALAEQATQLTAGRDPLALRALAAARAETGQFTEAIRAAEQALKLEFDQNNTGLADSLRQELRSYQAGSPVRER